MEEEHSKLWRLALVLSLIAFVAAAYLRIPPFRTYVDENYPWVKEQLVQRGVKIVNDPSEAVEEPTQAESSPAEFSSQPSTPAPTAPLTLEQIAGNRSLWPKVVTLKKKTVFPAVIDGKEAGKIALAAGATVQLYRVENQKLGVVYNGGGAWVQPEDTDLMERVRAAH